VTSVLADAESSQQMCLSSLNVVVGVCAHNEEKNVGRLLEVLASVHFPSEIVVVSSGSTDRTDAIVREHRSADSRVKLIIEPVRSGKAKAVNTIMNACRSDVLVLVSGDTLPARESIARLVRWFDDPGVGAVSARPVPVNPRKGFGWVAHIMWSAHWHYLWNLTQSTKLGHVSGEMCAFSSQALAPLPQDIINEDAYMATVANRTGFRMLLDPEAIVYMKAPTGIMELIDQRRRVLAGHRQVKQKTGHYPTVLAASWWMYRSASIRTLFSILREFRLRTWVWGPVLLLCEILALALTLQLFGHKTHLLWKPVKSTKNLAV